MESNELTTGIRFSPLAPLSFYVPNDSKQFCEAEEHLSQRWQYPSQLPSPSSADVSEDRTCGYIEIETIKLPVLSAMDANPMLLPRYHLPLLVIQSPMPLAAAPNETKGVSSNLPLFPPPCGFTHLGVATSSQSTITKFLTSLFTLLLPFNHRDG